MGYLGKLGYALRHPAYAWRRVAASALAWSRYDETQWARVVMYQEIFAQIRSLGPGSLSALEISPGGPASPWRALGFTAYRSVEQPAFDLCRDYLEQTFDIVIADQVFEHLLWPYRAARNVHRMLVPGGRFVCTTPFLIRVHANPVDCSRWTETGLKHLLAEAGFALDKIHTGSWGNLDCVRANLTAPAWARIGWGRSLRNQQDFPVAVWAIAEK